MARKPPILCAPLLIASKSGHLPMPFYPPTTPNFTAISSMPLPAVAGTMTRTAWFLQTVSITSTTNTILSGFSGATCTGGIFKVPILFIGKKNRLRFRKSWSKAASGPVAVFWISTTPPDLVRERSLPLLQARAANTSLSVEIKA